MLNKIGKAVEDFFDGTTKTDPARFQDPVALQTEWSAMATGGVSWRTRTLRRAGQDRVQFKGTIGATIFAVGFVLLGLVVVGAGLHYVYRLHGIGYQLAWPVLFGAACAGAGVWMADKTLTPIVFDRAAGYFWRGWSPPAAGAAAAEHPNMTPLAALHALQLLSARVETETDKFLCYELNLVLTDGSRRHVLDHGDGDRLRAEAHRLAEFLGVPLWDGA